MPFHSWRPWSPWGFRTSSSGTFPYPRHRRTSFPQRLSARPHPAPAPPARWPRQPWDCGGYRPFWRSPRRWQRAGRCRPSQPECPALSNRRRQTRIRREWPCCHRCSRPRSPASPSRTGAFPAGASWTARPRPCSAECGWNCPAPPAPPRVREWRECI